jgi:hypothetical protein
MRPYKAQGLAWWRPVTACFHNVGYGGAVAGIALLRRGRSHRADGDGRDLLTVKIYQPSHEFTFGVGISFIPYPLVLTPVV